MKTIGLCVSYRGVSEKTRACLAQLAFRVAVYVGVPDVALARNQGLTMVVDMAGKDHDVLVLVDDDMTFTREVVDELATRANETGDPWSAIYSTAEGHMAATRLDWDARERERWMVGLGCCAIPMASMVRLAGVLGTVRGPNGRDIVPYCQSTVIAPEHDGRRRWCSEDYWLCGLLGGFRLARLAAGHVKPVPLLPDEQTLLEFGE